MINMRILKSEAILVLLLTSLFLFSKYISWIAVFPLLVLGSFFFIINRRGISKNLLKLSFLPFTLVFIGTISISPDSDLKAILRDLLYYAQPLFILVFSYLLANKVNSFSSLLRVFIFSGVLLAMAHFIEILFNPEYITKGNLFKNRIKSSYIVSIALAFLVISQKKKILTFSTTQYFSFVFILLLSVTLSFSRTMIVVTLLIILFGSGSIKLKLKSTLINILLLLGLGIGVSISSNSQILQNGEKTLFSKFAHSINEMQLQDYTERSDINKNWRGYEAYRGFISYLNDGGTINHLFGYGFGKESDLGLSISLKGKDFDAVSIFHNGYINILLKTGAIGLLLYIFYFLLLFSKTYNHPVYGMKGNLTASLFISMLFMTSVVAGWLNNSLNMPFIMFFSMALNILKREKDLS